MSYHTLGQALGVIQSVYVHCVYDELGNAVKTVYGPICFQTTQATPPDPIPVPTTRDRQCLPNVKDIYHNSVCFVPVVTARDSAPVEDPVEPTPSVTEEVVVEETTPVETTAEETQTISVTEPPAPTTASASEDPIVQDPVVVDSSSSEESTAILQSEETQPSVPQPQTTSRSSEPSADLPQAILISQEPISPNNTVELDDPVQAPNTEEPSSQVVKTKESLEEKQATQKDSKNTDKTMLIGGIIAAAALGGVVYAMSRKK